MHRHILTASSSSSPSSSPPQDLHTSSITSSVSTVSRSIGAVLPQPILSVESSVLTRLSDRTSTVSSSRLQPILHPHARFLNRLEENCPTHLSGKQRTNWLKAGRKAQANQQLLLTLPRFSWPQHNSGEPIFINRITSDHTLQSIIHDLSNVHLFSIDTESTMLPSNPSAALPSLIQIEAIHNMHSSMLILIEIQHLPQHDTMEFSLIQHICQQIFNPSNRVITWGDPHAELKAFEDFDLFCCSNIHHPINLQQIFAQYWNSTHPHESQCPISSYAFSSELFSDEIICIADSTDLTDAHALPPFEPDSSSCTCSSNIRPYKSKAVLWSLQKAVHFLFNETVDKELTMSVWSNGLDHTLHPFSTDRDRQARDALVLYAITDVIALTRIYCHIFPSNVPQSSSTIVSTNDPSTTESPIQIPTSISSTHDETLPEVVISSSSTSKAPTRTVTTEIATKPLVYILSDSHGKYLSKNMSVCNYDVQVNSISGLRFVDQYTPNLCATTILHSPETSIILSNARGVMFLLGTNSVRSISSSTMIDQVINIVYFLRENYPSLSCPDAITFILVFPCYKPSNTYNTTSSLLNNITNFNERLNTLSRILNFSTLDLQVNAESLSSDHMHIHGRNQRIMATLLSQYIDRLSLHIVIHSSPIINTNSTNATSAILDPVISPLHESNSSSEDELVTESKQINRTTSSKNRRNRRRHDKRHLRRLENILSREVSSCWTLSSLKQYLRTQSIRFAFLAPIRNSMLRIAFNDPVDLAVADQVISQDFFDESHYNSWSLQQQQQPQS